MEDELTNAARVAQELGTDHCELVLEAKRLPSVLDQVVAHLDEPLYSTVLPNTFELSKAAKEYGRVVLSGDGSDEVLFGYEYVARAWRKVQGGADWADSYAQEVGWLVPQAGPLMVGDLPRPAAVLLEAPGDTPLDKMKWFELRHRLPEYHFARVDRMSMAHSIEVRVPFVRNSMLDWSAGRDPLEFVGTGAEKAGLRALDDVLPMVVRTRPKRPFTSPTSAWLRGSLRSEVEALLHDRGTLNDLGLDAHAVQSLLKRYFGGEDWLWRPTWGIFILVKWYQATRNWMTA